MVDGAFELRILRPQGQRGAQPRERFGGPPHPTQQLAERDEGLRIVGEPAGERRQRGEGPLRRAGPLLQPGEVDGQRRQVGTQRRRRGQPGGRRRAVAPGPRPAGELVQDIDVGLPIAAELAQRPLGVSAPAG